MTFRTVGIFTVNSALAALVLCAGLLAGCKGQSEQAAAPQGVHKPRLVLQITVDQFRGDLRRWPGIARGAWEVAGQRTRNEQTKSNEVRRNDHESQD